MYLYDLYPAVHPPHVPTPTYYRYPGYLPVVQSTTIYTGIVCRCPTASLISFLFYAVCVCVCGECPCTFVLFYCYYSVFRRCCSESECWRTSIDKKILLSAFSATPSTFLFIKSAQYHPFYRLLKNKYFICSSTIQGVCIVNEVLASSVACT